MEDFQAFSGMDYIVDYIVDENYTSSYRKEILTICDKSQIRLFAFVVLQNAAKKCILKIVPHERTIIFLI